jgi:hypothetical protein
VKLVIGREDVYRSLLEQNMRCDYIDGGDGSGEKPWLSLKEDGFPLQDRADQKEREGKLGGKNS